jgi:hypothetical protein
MSTAFPVESVRAVASELKVPERMVRAVAQVESSGQAFLPPNAVTPRGLDVSGRPVIQFEGHVFWKYLPKLTANKLLPSRLLKDPKTKELKDETGRPIGELLSAVLYPSLTLKHTRPPSEDWDQLLAARAIHGEAANQATSWGAFQIMGFNHKACGFASGTEMAEAAATLEGQFRAFARFVASDKRLVAALVKADFAAFARIYNGPAYAKYGYDRKLAMAYRLAAD